MQSLRENAVSVLASLSDKKMFEFIKLFGDDNALARAETFVLAHDPDAKTYASFQEAVTDMENESDDED